MAGLREFEYYEEQYSYKQYEQDVAEEEYWDELLEEMDEDATGKGEPSEFN